jgi:hypothetical protein
MHQASTFFLPFPPRMVSPSSVLQPAADALPTTAMSIPTLANSIKRLPEAMTQNVLSTTKDSVDTITQEEKGNKIGTTRYIYGSLTRISDLELYPFEVCKIMDKSQWATGDYLVGKYLCQDHEHAYASAPVSDASNHFCELPTGRHRYYLPGDIMIGALGSRNATQELCGDWWQIEHPNPNGGPTILDDIVGAGLFGKKTSRSSRYPSHAQFDYQGHAFRRGKKICMKDFVPAEDEIPSQLAPPECPTILIIGTSMSCGKSCTGRVVIRSLQEMAIPNIMAAKLTGAGYYNDILGFSDAGATSVLDFVDVGLPSTVLPPEEYRKSLQKLFGMINTRHPDVQVIEAGASPCESYNGQVVLEAFCHHKNLFVILCASDAYAVTGAKQHLATVGIKPDLVAGIIANTSAGRDLVMKMNNIPASGLDSDEAIEEFVALMSKKLGLKTSR